MDWNQRLVSPKWLDLSEGKLAAAMRIKVLFEDSFTLQKTNMEPEKGLCFDYCHSLKGPFQVNVHLSI